MCLKITSELSLINSIKPYIYIFSRFCMIHEETKVTNLCKQGFQFHGNKQESKVNLKMIQNHAEILGWKSYTRGSVRRVPQKGKDMALGNMRFTVQYLPVKVKGLSICGSKEVFKFSSLDCGVSFTSLVYGNLEHSRRSRTCIRLR